MAGRASTEDPLKGFRFRIEIDGFFRAGFKECSPLKRETDVVEYREGGANESPQKSAGLTKFSDITLKRGQIVGSLQGGDDDFITWLNEVHDVAVAGNGANYRRTLDIVQFNSLNDEVRRWRVGNAWPHEGQPFGELKADASDNSLEELVVCHEGYELVP